MFNSEEREEDEAITPVSHAVISRQQLEALISDLESLAQVEQIMVRPAGRSSRDVVPTQVTLREIPEVLGTDEGHGVQLRYRYDGALWIDTLTPSPDGIRLVRIRHDAK